MRHFGLEPAWLFNSLTIFVQLTGSALIIARRWTWLGAGALGIFTFLTIPIVHAFWRREGERAITALHTAGEHVGMIGALVLVSIMPCGRGPDPIGREIGRTDRRFNGNVAALRLRSP